MAYAKRIVCLANSRKISGRCVAGKEISQQGKIDGWIRPVSDRPTGELSEEERRYKNGADPALLEIITIPMKNAAPHAHQPENHIIDPDRYWEKSGAYPLSQIDKLLDSPSTLWATGDSAYSHRNNRIPQDALPDSSLYLVRVRAVTLVVGPKAPEFDNHKQVVRAHFSYGGDDYIMDVTDPLIERKYLARGDGEYAIRSPVLCASLSEPYKGYCYKLVAAVIAEEGTP